MTDNIKRLLEKISADSALTERASGMDRDALIALARDLGIELSDTDFDTETNADMSDDELELVAGGGACACAVGGLSLIHI